MRGGFASRFGDASTNVKPAVAPEPYTRRTNEKTSNRGNQEDLSFPKFARRPSPNTTDSTHSYTNTHARRRKKRARTDTFASFLMLLCCFFLLCEYLTSRPNGRAEKISLKESSRDETPA
jgi:hypothetical protein